MELKLHKCNKKVGNISYLSQRESLIVIKWKTIVILKSFLKEQNVRVRMYVEIHLKYITYVCCKEMCKIQKTIFSCTQNNEDGQCILTYIILSELFQCVIKTRTYTFHPLNV